VLQVFPKEDKVLVEGINVHARHRKPDQTNPQGGIDRRPAPLHISNVSVAGKDGKATRVRFEVRDGKKVRVAVKSGEVI
jgi:large subunit ribosomal protein L24